MIDEKRLQGDLLYFTTGDRSKLTKMSIYSRIFKRDGKLYDTYSLEIKDKGVLGVDTEEYDFDEYAKNAGNKMPCFNSIKIEDDIAYVTFNKVDMEQLQYDLAVAMRVIPAYCDISVCINKIKNFK